MNHFLEEIGDAFDLMEGPTDALCITTNGTLKNDGSIVAGRGIALQAKTKWQWFARVVGDLVYTQGNHVHLLTLVDGDYFFPRFDPVMDCIDPIPDLWNHVLSFPVKGHWKDDACPKLIERSAIELMAIVRAFDLKRVILPRPGCGNGGLAWEDVKGILGPILDDRVVVVTK